MEKLISVLVPVFITASLLACAGGFATIIYQVFNPLFSFPESVGLVIILSIISILIARSFKFKIQ